MSRTTFDDEGNFSVNEILQFSKALLTTYYFEWKDQRQKLILPDNFSASIYYTTITMLQKLSKCEVKA